MGTKGCKHRTHLFTNSFILTLAVCSQLSAQSWQPLGPGPLLLGQSEGIPNTPVIGAIHGIATHPTDDDIIYVATVNGGIWKTTNGTAASPNWVAQTDDQPSLSMSDIEFDPTDATAQTLIASSGRFSSLASTGGSRAGVMRTTDGGANWTDLNGGMDGRNITSVEARGATLLAAVNVADSFTCANIGVFRSINTGGSWTQLNNATNGIPRGASAALTADPSDNATFYASIHNFSNACSSTSSGIYKTTDTGANWSKVSNASIDTLISANNCHTEIAVGNNNNVFVAMVCTNGDLDAVFYSANGGTSWTSMDLPETTENGGVVAGIHPGGQGSLHSSLAADPVTDTIVYIGGDRQPREVSFPNSIGANNFSGRLFRGDASQASGSQWTPLTHSGTASNSSPHADSRDLVFDANNSLLEADDGGIYRQTSSTTNTGDWISVNGDMAVNEQHDTAYDTNSAITISGNQDNGSSRQQTFGSTTWQNFGSGDGGDVVIDNLSLAGSNQSVRFQSSQNLSGIRRLIYDANNNFLGQTPLALSVTSGSALTAQFVTPLAINNINGNRLIVGGGNSVYESSDQGDTVTEIGAGIVANSLGRNTIAYGATGNEDILYVAGCIGSCFTTDDGGAPPVAQPDGIYVRTTGAGALNHVFTPSSGRVEGITINPANPAEAFAIEEGRVLRTVDTGANWTNITGSLSGFGQLRSIMFMPDATDNGLAVGSDRGVFLSRASGGYSNWITAATGMPNTPVFELSYDQTSSRLVAGTMGRGAFVLTGILTGNTPPVANTDSIMVSKGGTATTVVGGSNTLLNNDTDPDAGDNLTVQTTPTTQPMNGIITLQTDGTFSYQHDDSFTNSDQFFYQICDDGSPQFCSDGQVDVTIDLGSAICSNPNIAIPDNGGAANPATDMLNVTDTGSITDLNLALQIDHTWVGDLTVTLTHESSGTSVTLIDRPGSTNCQQDDISVTLDDAAAEAADDQCETSGGAINGTFQPTGSLADFNGLGLNSNWTLSVSDFVSQDDGALISWCLDPTTSAATATPVLAAIGNQNIDELATLNFTATATDADTSQANLVFTLSGQPTGASITTGGAFTFTPTEAQGPDTFTFDVIVSDDSVPANTDSETITVTVNEANVNPVLVAIGNQNIDELNELTFTAMATDTDLPSQNLSFSLSGEPSGATITSGGAFSFTPTETQGPDTFTFDVIVTDDGTGTLSDSETITVTVNEVNQNPVLDAIGAQSIEELNTLSFTATATDPDLPVQNLTFSLSGEPTGASITSGGNFSFTPTSAQGPNSYTFDVIVTDDGTGNLSDSETITVNVSDASNQPPVLAPIGNQNIDELSSLSFIATATDADTPTQNLTFSLSGEPAGASITAGGSFSFTPTETQGPNSYTFDVVVTDDGTGNLSDSETITVTVNESNQNPVLNAIGNQSVDELSTLSFTATATDADLPTQNLTFSLSGEPAGASITSGGVFSFTPTAAQGPNSYTFDVIVTDDGPGNLSSSETITVEVNDPNSNQSPVLLAIGNQIIDELNTLSFTAMATDADTPAQNLTFSLSGQPTGATITTDGIFSFTPTEAQGPDNYTFDVIVTDDGPGNLSDSETITVTVNENNISPVLNAIGNQSTDELSTLSFTATATDPDVPTQNLTFSLSGEPTGATITSAGVFSFTPSETQGPDTFTFDVIVSDGELSDSETITITVNEINENPVLDAVGDQQVDELTTLNFTATATDPDLPIQNLTFSLSGAPTGANITSDGQFSFTPTLAQSPNVFTFDIIVSDGQLIDTETISITVIDVIFRSGFE